MGEFLPFWHLTDGDFSSTLDLDPCLNPSDELDMLNSCQPSFSLFEDDEYKDNYRVQEIDPDINYFDLHFQNVTNNCKYYSEKTFNKDITVSEYASFSVMHTNIRSIPRNLSAFLANIENLDNKFSVLAFTETWLNSSTAELYHINGYEHVFKVRTDRLGGGVSLFIQNHLNFQLRPELNSPDHNIETLFCEIDKSISPFSKNIIIGVIYRPPNTDMTKFNAYLNIVLDLIAKEGKLCYILGDFNINLLNESSHSQTHEFLDNMLSHSFLPVINRPTRVTEFSASLIDNIFTNNYDHNYECKQGVLLIDVTDHYPIFHINNKITATNEDKFIFKRIWDSKSYDKFINEINNTDWDPIYNCNDTQIAYTLFHNILYQIFDKHFPMKRIKLGYKTRKPWLTPAIKASIKHKNKLSYVAKLHPTAFNKTQYHHYKSLLNKIMRISERNHYQLALESNRTNLKKSWQILKEVIGRNSKKIINTKFTFGETETADSEIISEKFNQFFLDIGHSLASAIPAENLHFNSFLHNDVTSSIYLSPVDNREIERIIKTLKKSSPGWDEITSDILGACSSIISHPLVHIINLSLMDGIFPTELKIAKVLPLFKNGDPSQLKNYRPVSILSTISKIFEKIMYTRLLDFFNKHNVLYKYQFGFRKGHSTDMALVTLIEKVSNALEKGEYVLGLFLDFSKAFDTVDHAILIDKLQHYGIRGIALKWIKSYINNRTQFVSYNGHYSSHGNITCGVPQGSILGPLLFLLYINDLAHVSKKLFILLFADDTNAFLSDTDISSLESTINIELHKLSIWLNCNKLSLNIDKTHFMLFCTRKPTREIHISLNNHCIAEARTTKFLGVIIDNKLSWKDHIAYIHTKISKNIGIIIKAGRYFNKDTVLNLYYTFIFPYLYYCNIVWGNTFKTHLQKLVTIQKKVIRIISKVPNRTHTADLFVNLNVLSLSHIYDYSVAIFMYKYTKGLLPKLFDEMFFRNSQFHRYNTRQEMNIPSYKLTIQKQSIKYYGPQFWNSISLTFDTNCSIHTFKRHLKKHLIITFSHQ